MNTPPELKDIDERVDNILDGFHYEMCPVNSVWPKTGRPKCTCGIDNEAKIKLKSLIEELTVEARIDEVKHMPHERDPEMKFHKFVDGNEMQLEYCRCYKGNRIADLKSSLTNGGEK